MEMSVRDIEFPVGTDPGESDVFDWDEELYRAYVNWTPTASTAVGISYEREYFDAGELSAFVPNTITHRLPIDLSYFHPSGIYGKVRTAFIYQDLDEVDEGFILTDLTLGYRLPKRFGILEVGVRNLFGDDFNYQGQRLP